jgi:hypothetical protein
LAEIVDRKDLARWLKNRPREDAVVIAARAALRVAPLLVTALNADAAARRAAIVLQCLRAMAAPLVAAVGPTKGAKVRSAATTATTAEAAAWKAVSADAMALEQGQSPEQVAAMALWPENPPGWVDENWARLKDQLLAANEGWEVWTGWYEDRLHGRRFNKALEEARVLIDAELWEQGPKAVNAEIARLIEDRTTRDANFKESRDTIAAERQSKEALSELQSELEALRTEIRKTRLRSVVLSS